MAEEKKQGAEPKEKKTKKEKPPKAREEKKKEFTFDGQPYETIKFVLMTEKAIRFIEPQNRLVFVVDRKARKNDVRKAVQAAFQSKVSNVNVLIDQKGRKRAFVTFEKPGEAGEIAIRLGII